MKTFHILKLLTKKTYLFKFFSICLFFLFSLTQLILKLIYISLYNNFKNIKDSQIYKLSFAAKIMKLKSLFDMIEIKSYIIKC